MIDLHSHILPGVDDGAEDMKMALEMAQLYVENGYDQIIATPHWIEYGGTTKRSENIEVLASFIRKLEEAGIELKVRLGNEFFITPNLVQYVINQEGATLNNSDYVLVELPMRDYPQYTENVIFDLQLKGYKPIIAHPERYEYFRETPEVLAKLIERGIYTQMNLPSLTGQYGKEVQKSAKVFLEHQMVHFLGTDSHSNRRRSPRVKEALQLVEEMVGKEMKEELTNLRAKKVIENQSLVVPNPIQIKKKKWFQFWK